MLKAKIFIFTVSITALSFLLIQGHAGNEGGPFAVKRTVISKMPYTFVRKLEEPTLVSVLARSSPDGTITLRDDVVISVPGKEDRTYAAGTVLNPILNPEDDILLPIDVSVSNLMVADGKYTVGRFAYLGNVPRFESENLEMFASKMGHSLRVKAWVTPEIIDGYELALLTRFQGFYSAFMKPTMHFEQLQSMEAIAASAKNPDVKKWATVASYYSKHLIENPVLDIYATPATEAEYKQTILVSMLRMLMNDLTLSVQDGLDLLIRYKNEPNFILARKPNSAALFAHHLGHRYTQAPGIDPQKPERLGFLTFVYPIAIDKRGPLNLPKPGVRTFPLHTSIEARWWSNRWIDEFGGFPFLQITVDGVAFHGPITMNHGASDTWYLRRDDVSHSCMRMDPSDLLELRALIPKKMNQLEKLGKTIPLRITEWPDVTDADHNGANEVMDVAYYSIPTSGAAINIAENWRPTKYNKNTWNKYFGPYVGRLRSKNTFKVVSNLDKTENRGEFTGLPKYDVVDGVLSVVGYYPEVIPIMTFPQRPTSIIQYREDGIVYKDADEFGGDTLGSYPPSYFNRL